MPGCSKRPSSKAAASEVARRTLLYVEPLSDARTMLAAFFSILLKKEVALSHGQDPHRLTGEQFTVRTDFVGL
jgi:hypothetical protein